MRVQLFIERYPNPYTPWIDTQVIHLLRAAHDVRVFAEAAYTSTIHDEVRQYHLQSRTSYYPSTLRSLPSHALPALGALLGNPFVQVPRMVTAAADAGGPKLKLLAATRALRLPVESPHLCYIHNLPPASRLTFLRRLYPHARVCLYFHGGELAGKVRGEAALFDSVHAVVTNTRFSAEQIVERGCPLEKIAVVPVGFHLPSYAPSPHRPYRPDGTVRLISVGRMSPEKGFMYALKAVKRLRDSGEHQFVYTLIGVGPQFAELQRFARQQGLDGPVRFVGEKTRKEVAAALESADVFILPSVVTETQAAVVQEALLMGCLTVTTLAGGVPESNAEVMRPFSVPPGDVDALARALKEVIALDATAMARLGRSGRTFAAQRYDIGPLMDRILAHATGRLAADDPCRFVRDAPQGRAEPTALA